MPKNQIEVAEDYIIQSLSRVKLLTSLAIEGLEQTDLEMDIKEAQRALSNVETDVRGIFADLRGDSGELSDPKYKSVRFRVELNPSSNQIPDIHPILTSACPVSQRLNDIISTEDCQVACFIPLLRDLGVKVDVLNKI